MKYKKDYYQILGVKPNATATEIRRAYRRLALANHPDKNPTSQATARMQEINEAFGIIGETNKRIKYDFEYLISTATIQANDSGSKKNAAAARKSQHFYTQDLKAPRNFLSSFALSVYLVLFPSLVFAAALLFWGIARNSYEDIISKPSPSSSFLSPTLTAKPAYVSVTVTPGPILRPVCASYFKMPGSRYFVQDFWTNDLEATQSREACIAWMESAAYIKQNCTQPSGTISIMIVLIDKSRHNLVIPDDLNYYTEFVARKECSTQ